jgi:tetratricopeptide (TPR) repeat protein
MDKALKEGKKALELDRSFKKQNFKNFIIYIRKEESNKAIDSLLKFFVSAYPEEDYAQHLNNVYKELGLSGVIRFTIEKLLQNSKVDHFIIAQLYALLYDKKSTIAYLNKALFTSSQIPRIKNCLDFRFISDEPDFHILLESLYLPKD